MRPTDALLRQLNPMLAYFKPYAPDITAFFTNVPALFASRDAVGYRGRVFPVGGPQIFSGLTTTQRQVLESLLKATGGDAFYNVKTNSYPKPGAVGKESPSDGEYPRVEADK